VIRSAAALVAVALASLAVSPVVGAAGDNRAGIVVRSGDDVREMCVFFDEDEITGEELLRRAGLEVVAEGNALGTAVCSLDGKGCSKDDCFCRYPTFWGYWTKDDGERWRFSDVGASSRVVTDGSLDGWSFGRDGKPAPKDVDIDEVCDASQALPTIESLREPVSSRPNYAPFAALIGALVAVASILAIRRRRRGPSGT
jgi:hypothetical protein